MVTIKDIAKEVGVSPTTVSNVIKGNYKKVSKETADKILAVIKEKQYVPNMGARMLANNKSNIIGVIVNALIDLKAGYTFTPYVAEILGVIEKEINDNGYYAMLYSSKESDKIYNLINTWQVDGIITISMSSNVCRKIAKNLTKPAVYTDCYFDKDEPYINVGCDDEGGTYNLINYLIKKGHKKIGYVYDCNFKVDNKGGIGGHRLLGYKKAMNDAGLRINEDLLFFGNKNKKEEWFEKIYNKINDMTAIALCYDYFALELIGFLRSKGVEIPKDLSIVGFDDIDMSRLMYPALTTVNQGIKDKGVVAVKQLIKLINNEPIKDNDYKVKTRIIERDSVYDLTKK